MKVEDCLAKERKGSNVPVQKISEFLYGKEQYHQMREYLENGPEIHFDFNMFNKGREELVKDAYRKLPTIYNYLFKTKNSSLSLLYTILVNPHQLPGSAHYGMFIKYIELMGTEKQKQQLINKSWKYQIVGCYGQTELGHGSDVRSLETVATFDQKSGEFVINSPSISAAKFWPGEIAILANYGLIFAQTIIKGQNKGVFPFLVQLKDSKYNWLPGIEGGDIGPKIGFHAKQNGYLLFKNVRVPSQNLVNKYIKLTKNGDFTIQGDPRIGYGTMMSIRQYISCVYPKIYAQAITIAIRYSIFRKQFKNEANEEMTIIDYQAQQDKLIPRIAEYYAITTAGERIRQGSQENNKKVLNNDLSLLQETHSNLSFSKAYFSQTVYDGMEICRRACGGHGYSHYSGIPILLNQYAAHNTHEGENTVMYLQTGNYILKNYRNFMTKKTTTGQSVRYVQRLQEILSDRITKEQNWSLQDLNTFFLQEVAYLVNLISLKMVEKDAKMSESELLNGHLGTRLQSLAMHHGIYYTFNSFKVAIERKSGVEERGILTDVCLLFGICQLLKWSSPLIEGNFITKQQIASLYQEKEALLKRLRPNIIHLIDSFGFPERYYRSELVRGNPYQNFLNAARGNQINQSIPQSGLIVRGISKVLATHHPTL